MLPSTLLPFCMRSCLYHFLILISSFHSSYTHSSFFPHHSIILSSRFDQSFLIIPLPFSHLSLTFTLLFLTIPSLFTYSSLNFPALSFHSSLSLPSSYLSSSPPVPFQTLGRSASHRLLSSLVNNSGEDVLPLRFAPSYTATVIHWHIPSVPKS